MPGSSPQNVQSQAEEFPKKSGLYLLVSQIAVHDVYPGVSYS